MGVPTMYRCPNCGSDGSTIDWSGSYFEIYECSSCRKRFCYKCPSSYNGHYCAHCGEQCNFKTVGRVYK